MDVFGIVMKIANELRLQPALKNLGWNVLITWECEVSNVIKESRKCAF